MTGRELISVLARNVTFPSGIASKRFVRDMDIQPAEYVLSERAELYAWRIAYIYRRQLPSAVAKDAILRKRNHRWGMVNGKVVCEDCLRGCWSARERNAPCPGPPLPPKPKRERRKSEVSAPISAEETQCPLFP